MFCLVYICMCMCVYISGCMCMCVGVCVHVCVYTCIRETMYIDDMVLFSKSIVEMQHIIEVLNKTCACEC